MGPPDSLGVTRDPRYSGFPLEKSRCQVRDCHPVLSTFPDRSPGAPSPLCGSYNPDLHAGRFGLVHFRSPLLAESHLISFPTGTEMFQFPALAPFRVTSRTGRVSPFGHLRIVACLPASRSFSQAPASFIASGCQGIHHMPFVAYITFARSSSPSNLKDKVRGLGSTVPTTTSCKL